MRNSTGAALAAALLLVAACGGDDANNTASPTTQGPLTQIPAPNNGDWTQIVSRTTEGGTRIGNPDAPVKLVEYGSLTCPACKAFSDTGGRPLTDTYVRSGQVSWEFRHLIIHGAADAALALLADCQPPAAFFSTIEDVYEEQSQLITGFEDAEQQQVAGLPPEQQIAATARAMDLGPFFSRRGLAEGRQSQCLADSQAVQRLADNTNRAATQEGVNGTPTFFINGEKLSVSNWPSLEPLLRQRIGG